MKKFLLLCNLLLANRTFSQCPFPATLNSSGGNYLGATLHVATASPLSQIVWYKDGIPFSTVTANTTSTIVTVAGGNGQGSAANQLSFPKGIFVDGNNNLYVSDYDNWRIQKWASGAISGITVAGGNGIGTQANQSYPVGVYVDGCNNVYIGDYYLLNNRVQKWAPGATSGIAVAGGNGQGSGANQLYGARGIDMDAAGNIYVADAFNQRIQKWAPGATSGITVAGGNGRGSGANQLDYPSDVKLDIDGNIYIADVNNSRIQKWTPGATSGITVAGGNGSGANADQFNGAYGIYVDGNKNVYVADDFNERVQKWAPGATSGITVAGGNGNGSAMNQLNGPSGVFVDPSGNIYVSDLGNNRVQKYTLLGAINTTYTPTTPGTYTAVVTDNGSCNVPTNPIVINAAISISTPATTVNGCDPVTFTANVSNPGNNPVYQWQLNGTNAGTNSPLFVDAQPVNGDVVTCKLTSSNAACATPTGITGSSLPLVVTPPPPVTLMNTSSDCLGKAALMVVSPAALSQIVWYKDGVAVNTATANPVNTGYTPTEAGSYTAFVTIGSGCSVTTNAVMVSPTITSSLSVAASSADICQGTPVTFIATAVNGGISPVFQWQINSINTGINSATYTDASLTNGAIVSCIMTPDAICPAAPTVVSNLVRMTVNASPTVQPGQVYSISQGQSIILNPNVTGDIAVYSWTPAIGLSNAAIANPVADPPGTTEYNLKVTTAHGCEASGDIIVKVLTQLRIPNAFTPNGDGKNDIFYIMGGPAGSIIKSFAIFGRWGQPVFQVHDVTPGDPGYGWNGYSQGSPAPTGAYVYLIEMKFNDGSSQVLKGTVMLVR